MNYNWDSFNFNHLPQVRCLCCGLDFRGRMNAIEHHDNNRKDCVVQREKRMARLKGTNPAIPAVVELLHSHGISHEICEEIAALDPKWLKYITGANMAWDVKEKVILKGSRDLAYALLAINPYMEDAIKALEVFAKDMKPKDAQEAWSEFYRVHLIEGE